MCLKLIFHLYVWALDTVWVRVVAGTPPVMLYSIQSIQTIGTNGRDWHIWVHTHEHLRMAGSGSHVACQAWLLPAAWPDPLPPVESFRPLCWPLVQCDIVSPVSGHRAAWLMLVKVAAVPVCHHVGVHHGDTEPLDTVDTQVK